MKFPFAEKVLSVCKFLVFDPLAVSTEGEPIMAEGMLPLELWDVVSVEDYLQFRLYGLELISIMLGNFHHFVFNFAPLFQFHFTSYSHFWDYKPPQAASISSISSRYR